MKNHLISSSRFSSAIRGVTTRGAGRRLLLLAALAAVACTAVSAAEAGGRGRRDAGLQTGAHAFTFDNRGEPIKVSTYKPPTYDNGPLIVVIHGSGRNSDEYRDNAIAMAERFGGIVVAPEFDWARFGNERYKRNGGVTKDGKVQPQSDWTYDLIDRVVQDVRKKEGKGADWPYYMIGHSGGAQTVVRMALFMPEGPRRFVSANSGSYTFLDRSVKFPYGLGGLSEELSNDAFIRRYLAAPLVLFLGKGDTTTGKNYFGTDEMLAARRERFKNMNLTLNGRPLTPAQLEERVQDVFDNSPEANAQGLTRYARGKNFFESARKLAAERGWAFNWRLVETEGIGHSGGQMFKAPEVEEALFGARGSQR